jgi:predicted ATPase
VVYSEMLEGVRRRYHLRAAQVLEQDGVAGVLDEKSDRLAHHYLQSGDLAQAINYLARSIRRSRQLHASDAAASYTDKALDAVEQLSLKATTEQERDQRRKQKQDLLAVRDSLKATQAK